MATNNITGIRDVQRLLDRVGRAPAKVLTKATKLGAYIVRNQARANAPVDSGALKRGIKLKAEKRRAGKKVYQISFFGRDGKTGEEFIKIESDGSRSFYPVSQEYGWKSDGGYIEGKRFLRDAFENNREAIKDVILTSMFRELNSVR